MRRLFVILLAALALPACSMLNSASIPENASIANATGGIACQGEAGAYYLPKAYFRVQVTADRKAKIAKLKDVVVNYRPDRGKGYCLDYASSPTAHDRVNIYKTKAGRQFVKPGSSAAVVDPTSELAASGSDLLHALSTDAIDESAYISKTLIRSLFIGISGNPGFTLSSAAVGRSLSGVAGPDETNVFDAEYDPFNLAQTALINQALAEFGFCIVVQGITIGRHGETLNSYCDDPVAAAERRLRFADTLLAAEQSKVTGSVSGILYRPRIPYTVLLLVKANKKVKGGWEIRGSEVAPLENISPVLAVRVDRAFFADRKTTLLFDQGALANICIGKTSELKNFVDIPLEIAQSIVAMPANIIQVRIDQTKGQQTLLAAEQKLIEAQIQQLKLEQAVTQAEIVAATPGAANNPNAPTAIKGTAQEAVLAALGATLEAQLLTSNGYTPAYSDVYSEFAAGRICPAPQSITAGAIQ